VTYLATYFLPAGVPVRLDDVYSVDGDLCLLWNGNSNASLVWCPNGQIPTLPASNFTNTATAMSGLRALVGLWLASVGGDSLVQIVGNGTRSP